MRFVVADLKRGLTEGRFFLSVALGVGLAVVTFCFSREAGDGVAVFTQGHSLLLPFCAPLLCALPYSNMQMLERATGFDTMMATHAGRKSWVYQRLITNGLISGLVMLVPGLSLWALCLGYGAQGLGETVLGVLGLNFLFGVAFGSVSYGLCFCNTQSYIPLLAPQVLYWFALYACPVLQRYSYLPALAVAPWIMPSAFVWADMVTLLVAVLGLGLALATVGRLEQAVRP